MFTFFRLLTSSGGVVGRCDGTAAGPMSCGTSQARARPLASYQYTVHVHLIPLSAVLCQLPLRTSQQPVDTSRPKCNDRLTLLGN